VGSPTKSAFATGSLVGLFDRSSSFRCVDFVAFLRK
jgi:hypothetical protein